MNMKAKMIFILLGLLVSCTKTEPTEILSSSVGFDRTAYTISGKVVWEHDDVSGVKDVTITLSGAESQSTTTDVNGNYSFTVSNIGSYTITPSKLLNLTNGLDTADAKSIQRHVTLISLITDPYKRVAADCNKNNTISTVDAAIINQAILGNPSALAILAPSWKFVDASYTLTNPPGNFSVPSGFPQTITINLTGNETGKDFVGIKRGDVNGTANPAN